MIFLSPIFYSMAAQTRTGSPRYPTFVTTTKPQMGCIRYIQIWILRPYEFYIINISGFWYASLTSRLNKRDVSFTLFSLSISLSLSLSLPLISHRFLYLTFVIPSSLYDNNVYYCNASLPTMPRQKFSRRKFASFFRNRTSGSVALSRFYFGISRSAS